MIRINLIPFRVARKTENIRRQVSIFTGTFILVCLVLVGGNMMLNGKVKALELKVTATRNEINALKKITKEIEEIKKKLAILKTKTEVIQNLESNRRAPVGLLESMTQKVVPNRMWLTSMDEGDTSLQLKGIAVDNKTVADFMTRLEGSELYSGINLNTLKLEKFKKEMNLKSFEITCNKALVEKQATNKAKQK